MSKFDHKKIEQEIRTKWQELNINKTDELDENDDKFYSLYSFPYPSGSGLHVGHAEGMVANDIMARYYRMQGRKVTLPMGWDSFGLPAENYAIKTGVHPKDSTEEAIGTFIEQIDKLGIMVDWEKEVGAHRPDYYKWTQWFFSQLYKHGLAYKAKAAVNWDPVDQTVLANEQVLPDGTAERSGALVEKKELDQWFFKITDYADRLVDDLALVDWPEPTKLQQKNWIGRSEGINITYDIKDQDFQIICYTTRPDTNFGATFIVVAPESDFVKQNIDAFENRKQIDSYIEEALNKSDIDRLSEGRKKTGVFTGLYAVNNLNGKEMPIYVSDFVLATVGTGCVVGVPGHDHRDFEFAKEKDLEIVRVVVAEDGDDSPITEIEQVQEESGKMINSDFLDGMDIHNAKEAIKDHLVEKGWGERVVNYRLRDWLISRQRYWGAPIPVIWKERRQADKVLIMHGFAGNGQDNWQPWLVNEVKNLGIESVESPDFPNSDRPVLSEWLDKMNESELTKNSSVVAHSLGGFVALKYAEENKLKQLVLVATSNSATKEYWEMMKSKYGDKFPVDHLIENIYKDEIDAKKVVANVEEIVFIFSTDDPYISGAPQEKFEAEFGEFDNVQFRTFLNRRHFGRKSNCKDLPELLEYFGEKQFRALEGDDLPLELPMDVDFIPKGYSPLSRSEEYTQKVREKYGEEWTPEYDTQDTFACSSWYFFRFCDPKNSDEFAKSELLNKWLPADLYMIGAEHIVLHLMYARFYTKFLYDIGKIKFQEPFYKMRHMGMIAGPDGRKMSKRWGNVINPNDVVDEYGADTLRVYEMFMGPLDQGKAWNDSSVQGVRRFLDRVYRLASNLSGEEDENLNVEINKLIKKVTEDTAQLKFNTAVSAFMEFMNLAEKTDVSRDVFRKFVLALAPYAPYVTEHIWQEIFGEKGSIHLAEWPKYEESILKAQKVVLGVQVMGKLRGEIEIEPNAEEDEVVELAKQQEKIAKYLEGGIKKVIYIKGRVLNFVV